MKIREIILDFTSLLDITMIILFFFLLYSSIDVESVSEKAKAAEASYTEMQQENAKEQQEWREKASQEWERILAADSNAAANQEALSAYNEGNGLAFNLHEVESGDVWSLSVLSGNKKLDEISSNDKAKLKEELKACIKKAGYESDDVIIATFTYDGSSYGTAKAVPIIENAVINLQRDYKGLYFTSINISK
ncbi:biopolymer transporter ExbD [Ruminococcus flavefaciens]|uniref:biopolymer transporter ExbD n=1 Tax=Ruminococcus flavefaciens TaxID=1265 RepID=UPI000490BFD5|nr:biopolymer transporter ExbD [Ruminococcus flavefaciens]